MARVSLGLCGLLVAGCVSTQKLAEQPEPRPKNESFFLEETVNNDGVNYRVSLKRNAKPYATVFVKDEEDKTRVEFGKKGPFDFFGWKGNGEIIGFTDSDYNNGVGLNVRGNVGKTKLGVALERKVENNEVTNMEMIYASRKIGSTELTGGISNVNENVTGIFSVDYVIGQNIIGAGININKDGKGYGTAVVGRFPEKKVKGLGYRIWTRNDFEGNYLVDFLASTKSTISIFTNKAMISPEGPLGPKLFENWFDPHTLLWQRTSPGGVAGNMKFLSIGGSTTTSADLLYQFPEREGISPRLGLGYKVTDTGTERTDSVTGTIGTSLIDRFGNGGYVDFKVTDTRGDKTHSVIVGAQFKF